MKQALLFGEDEKDKEDIEINSLPQIKKFGQADISYVYTSDILTKTSGFLDTYDFTLNPYSGCSFACTYCYAAFFPREQRLIDNWGYWVNVKENGLEKLQAYRLGKKKIKSLAGKVIYMSSVTDPYQPIERKLGLVRSILEELVNYHQGVKLYVQTRSPLVVRDIDLLLALGNVQVNMTITTDDETVRRAFEPHCPSNKKRMDAIQKVHESGVDSCITMTPLLPLSDPNQFADDLLQTGVDRFIVQPFHQTKGKFVAGTREQAMKIVEDMNWSSEKYDDAIRVLQNKLPNLGHGKQGFSAQK